MLLAALTTCVPLVPAEPSAIAPGETTALCVDLERGAFLRVRVDSLGANVALTLVGRDGERLLEVDDRGTNESFEELEAVVEEPGLHRLEVTSRASREGAFRVAEVEMRRGDDADRERIAARRAHIEARWRLDAADAAVRGEALAGVAELAARLERAGLVERALALRRDAARARERAGETEEAIRLLVDLAGEAERRGEWRELAYVLDELVVIHHRRGDFTAATSWGERAIAAADRSGYGLARAQARGNFARSAGRVGRPDDAVAAWREAIELHTRLDREDQAVRWRFNLGAVAFHRGDLDGALEAFAGALPYFERGSEHEATLLVLSNLAATQRSLGRADLAVELLERGLGLPVADSSDGRRRRIGALSNLGRALEDLGRLDGAEARYREAEELARREGTADHVAKQVGNRAAVLVELGRAREALPLLAEAGALAAAGGDLDLAAWLRTVKGTALARLGRRDEARSALAEANALAVAQGFVGREIHARYRAAQVERNAGALDAGLAEIDRAIELAERVRAGLASEQDRATYLGSMRHLYDLALELRLRLHERAPEAGHAEAAFAVAERARARSLLDRLDPLRSPSPSPEAVALRDRAAELADAQSSLLALAGAAGSDGERRAAEARVAAAADALDGVRAAFVRARPREAALLEPPPTLDVAAVQRRLPAGAVLLEYAVGEEHAVLFVLARDRFEIRELAAPAELGRAVEGILAAIEEPSVLGAPLYRSRAAAAYDLLLGPAREALRGAQLLIVSPDGPLHRVPFAALVDDDRGGGFDELAYVVRRLPLAYLPSASTLARLDGRRRGTAARADLVVFGDPEMPTAGSISGATRSFLELGGELPRLPHARREAGELAALFDDALVFLGADASEARVKQGSEVAAARFLHFASHGLPNEVRPGLSALLLAPGGGEEDGLLQAWEIATLELASDLVVLAACRSALGREVAGEGFLGLTQAFLHAGVRGVVASQRTISDRATADLMAAFYRALAAGRVATEALAEAQRAQLARGGAAAHPATWAPFVIVDGLDRTSPVRP